MKKRVLILCTGNSCRSQMAEGWWRELGGEEWEVYSAGSQPAGFVHPIAVTVMRESGVDISAQESKQVDQFIDEPFDLVVTVCDNARESCPTLTGAKIVEHWPFCDPASATGSEEEEMGRFRRVRDQIRDRIGSFLHRRTDRTATSDGS